MWIDVYLLFVLIGKIVFGLMVAALVMYVIVEAAESSRNDW